ncbi:hypothetical protein AK88_00568 [Plasmodium fragile]|uniref:Uncharacterized protein n=1 Tax=Plasmodium fragile TaxID=5857 RepID=A0A0D9QSN4_PLAFR|nr:uncharacterized protein AK88_00568 [Plasmodium fragile]KJP89857.1 hypothetical protein AK88_00568 [Plasmodium fragile]
MKRRCIPCIYNVYSIKSFLPSVLYFVCSCTPRCESTTNFCTALLRTSIQECNGGFKMRRNENTCPDGGLPNVLPQKGLSALLTCYQMRKKRENRKFRFMGGTGFLLV